jgi:hypothetical protein
VTNGKLGGDDGGVGEAECISFRRLDTDAERDKSTTSASIELRPVDPANQYNNHLRTINNHLGTHREATTPTLIRAQLLIPLRLPRKTTQA